MEQFASLIMEDHDWIYKNYDQEEVGQCQQNSIHELQNLKRSNLSDGKIVSWWTLDAFSDNKVSDSGYSEAETRRHLLHCADRFANQNGRQNEITDEQISNKAYQVSDSLNSKEGTYQAVLEEIKSILIPDSNASLSVPMLEGNSPISSLSEPSPSLSEPSPSLSEPSPSFSEPSTDNSSASSPIFFNDKELSLEENFTSNNDFSKIFEKLDAKVKSSISSLLTKLADHASKGKEQQSQQPSKTQLKQMRPKRAYVRRKAITQYPLWQFLLLLLSNRKYQHLISWKSAEIGEFLISNKEEVAKLWGCYKRNNAMSYNKLARSLRHYYFQGILYQVKHKLHYQFTPEALKLWQKVQNRTVREMSDTLGRELRMAVPQDK